jgi:hypothetical protein
VRQFRISPTERKGKANETEKKNHVHFPVAPLDCQMEIRHLNTLVLPNLNFLPSPKSKMELDNDGWRLNKGFHILQKPGDVMIVHGRAPRQSISIGAGIGCDVGFFHQSPASSGISKEAVCRCRGQARDLSNFDFVDQFPFNFV